MACPYPMSGRSSSFAACSSGVRECVPIQRFSRSRRPMRIGGSTTHSMEWRGAISRSAHADCGLPDPKNAMRTAGMIKPAAVTRVPASLWEVVSVLAGTAWPPESREQAVDFLKFSDHERLLPLLFAQKDLPAAVDAMQQFRALDALHRSRYELSRRALLELVRVLGGDSFLLLKGSDYRFRLYSDPRLRVQ